MLTRLRCLMFGHDWSKWAHDWIFASEYHEAESRICARCWHQQQRDFKRPGFQSIDTWTP